MNPILEHQTLMNRRQLLGNSLRPLGAAALASLLGGNVSLGAGVATGAAANGGLPDLPHFAPKAKRVIYLFMCGGPSHLDTFDFHPEIR